MVAGYRVEPSTLRVRHAGEDAHIEAKAMQVLIYLADHAGQVVSRAELEEPLWPGRFVTADSLTGAIAKLRRVFGDDAHEPRVIELAFKRLPWRSSPRSLRLTRTLATASRKCLIKSRRFYDVLPRVLLT